MIPLKRERTNAVSTNFRGAKRIANNLELLQLKRDGKLDADVNKVLKSATWKPAKKQLLKESKNKCAYCETPTTVVAYGDVEHFRPKSRYWWLAYCYENYLASCTVCNQMYKSDNFVITNAPMKGPVVKATHTDTKLKSMAPRITPDPINDADGMPLQQLIDAMKAEFALLIDPYIEDPAEYLAYQPILANKEMLVVPAAAAHANVVKACEDFFGINRKELLDLRFQHYCTYMTFRHTLTATGLPATITTMIKNRLKEMKADGSQYAGMIRYFDALPLNTLPWDFDLVIEL
jgi:5-methylcytosine-specific restriction endonuclease McrA